MLRESQIVVLIALTVGSVFAWGVHYAWPGLPWFTHPIVASLVAWPVYKWMPQASAHGKIEEWD